MYQYQGFGLNISSEIEFPELLPATFNSTDVTISIGKTPAQLEKGEIVHRAFSSISEHEFLLRIRNICSYYCSNGASITAEPVGGIDERSVRLFLLGTAMAAILHQRGCIPFHASGIVQDGRLTLFAGNSGAGKSTILAALAGKGYTVFTDDICVLNYDAAKSANVLGTASYPMIKLWEDAIKQLNIAGYNQDFKVRPELPKYGQFFYESFNQRSLPVAKIIILATRNAIGFDVKKLEAAQAFKALEKQAYKYQLISNTALRTRHFLLLSQLVNQAVMYSVIRSEVNSDIATFCDTVENIL